MRADFVSTSIAAAAVALAGAVVCAALLAVLLKTGWAWRLATDVPNDRSLHVSPTPRVGGWGTVPVAVLAIVLLAPSLWLVAVAAVCLAAISQIDDRRGLPARVRFAAHLLAVVAIVVVYPAAVPWWALAIVAFLMLWLVNLYNFMDGADGLAGGMMLFGFGGYAFGALFAPTPSIELAWVSAAVAGAAAGFLVFNFHPARIFLGDAGSIPAGFLAGALGYWGWRETVWPLWFPAMVFAPFIGDASVTLLRRLLRGEKFWLAHREHYYQRMVRCGFGHAGTALIWYAVMLSGVVIALVALNCPAGVQWALVVIWMGTLLLIGTGIDVRWRRFAAGNTSWNHGG
ncbi:MraY family glycosyltransferase [Paraburkholderia caballeronis]|uniref:UDP-N-acetylmuramyl pentapeptide phosphotransferase/UDP-N-acetylglucosamine-1-phosphate transferase n=1 Tax=Paraburkholderia caballeronis TaxID=416943 RepID=A0A1H7R578_9BURK|nr:glycosyltransferase family 4 protein [Paraburkholderia caballeronis]PXW23660.1 UDP-N-acetylmuramyl pentapeptide phosphotransferase/UDP-N-acetylglucosamine-1-phosphate transferase [Paraburkholderia caballeronis]PXW99001.1 UDP-N-acetylmuramyl pentapeptide phosphotransferase/UDP-N-acetylglucosamine-1-phosphate transferase [Paraburkholderia caballeronis]RAJ96207.1 UDP-N-acetylmuramyl pentapeptide phosphotransferase/UDP-N-acetylglucosamine-1-phosphate transferase [Paraburkholderia caballeronis]SE